MQLRRAFFTVSFLIGCMPLVKAQTTSTPQYIAMYKDIAIDEMKRSGIPASITLAQGVLETQSGNSWLVQNSNNHFGIKCKNNWTGATVNYDDDARQECFRKYTTAADSYKDHSDFLKNNPRYSFLFSFQLEDYKSWAYGLKQAGYATSKTYPQQLIKVIEDYNLQQYTKEGEGLVPRSTPSTSASTTTKPSTTTTGKGNTATADKPIPTGIFEINGRKVIYAQAGTALIQLASEKDVKLRNLVKYNDLENDDPLPKSNYIFLEKKGKSGKNDFHVVKQGETMYDISQAEGIQLRWLRRRNKMKEGEEPAAGQKLALQGFASVKPELAKNAPVEDPTEGDLNPKEIVDDVKTEMERQQQLAQQQQVQQQQAQSQQQVNKLPDGMVDDLKKIGEVTPAGTSTSAKPAATATKTTPTYNPAPAATGTVTATAPTAPVVNASASVGTSASTPAKATPTYNPAPPVTTGTVTATAPAAPVVNASASVGTSAAAPTAQASTPTYNPAPPVATGTVTATTPASPVINASASVGTSAAAPTAQVSTPTYNPAPPVATGTVTATTPAAPVAPSPATPTEAPATQSPAQPVATTPNTPPPPASNGLPEGTIQVGNLLYHDVTSKETLYGIAKRYNVTVEQLREWNHLEAYDIKIGQRLLVGKI
ncbi:glucosaminidase domain-containing protein [[Flexibacter] sp. ATCC 35208]|uniref:glucosaminidase domain-containing protein n=1 Tax=[Flexibacter] sp. ATCC 35208 TaxID=1936242 RepID=UPI0009F9BDCE|nr:glucosaminidase domain-containing protein [[Flexibacter] sp. ATCC 35208]